jgi:membrane protein
MRLVNVKNTFLSMVRGVDENHTMAFAAALSYYFILSLFPLLIFVSAVIAYLPIVGEFTQGLEMLAQVLPAGSIGLMRQIVADMASSRHGSLLTFGLVFTIWSSSSGFAAMIEALNVAYGVRETRRIWTTRALAIGLTFLVGSLVVVALGVLMVGPRFGGWLAGEMELSQVFVAVWPYIRWSVATGFTVVAVELLYLWGPNTRQKLLHTVPGAVIAVAGWVGLSYALGSYFRNFAHYNATGTLGAAIALSVWVYWVCFIVLVGAEFNSGLRQETGERRLFLKDRRSTVIPDRRSETDMVA